VADAASLALIDALQIAYVSALDRQDMHGWLSCFQAEAASYHCITREGRDQDLPLALMMDDTYGRLKDRVKFVTEVWSGTYEDYFTRHFIQRLTCVPIAPSRFAVVSNFMVVYTTTGGKSEILVSGSYEDEVVINDGAARFACKRAVLDTVTTPRYLVYPI
jgi:3-phenylpropionate/cinnamic acid dioxygenase small subunit